MKTIKLKQFDITIELDEMGGGTISGTQKDCCNYCGQSDCYFSCDESQYSEDEHNESQDEMIMRMQYNSAIDGLESLLLAMACQNTPVDTPEMIIAIETALQAIDSNT